MVVRTSYASKWFLQLTNSCGEVFYVRLCFIPDSIIWTQVANFSPYLPNGFETCLFVKVQACASIAALPSLLRDVHVNVRHRDFLISVVFLEYLLSIADDKWYMNSTSVLVCNWEYCHYANDQNLALAIQLPSLFVRLTWITLPTCGCTCTFACMYV